LAARAEMEVRTRWSIKRGDVSIIDIIVEAAKRKESAEKITDKK